MFSRVNKAFLRQCNPKGEETQKGYVHIVY